MGCKNSVEKNKVDSKTNGSIDLNAVNTNQIINPYVPFTSKEVYSLKASWKAIKRNIEETGVLMFQRLLETNKEFIPYFEKFINIEIDNLFGSNVLNDHANAVMLEIDRTISEIDQAEVCHTKLLKIGADHKRRGIKDIFFLEIREPFLTSIEKTLGDRYTDRMKKIYEAFIEYLIKTLIEGFNS